MSSLIYERWQAVWDAMPVAIEGDDPEGVHDVRVASRRLRAAMDVSVDAFPARWFKPLHRFSKQITSELGEVRDRDVQLEYLQSVRESAEAGDRPGIDLLIDRLTAERDAARVEMLAFLEEVERNNAQQEVDRRFGTEETIPEKESE